MPGYEFSSVTTIILGVYGKEVEEEIFENEYVVFFFSLPREWVINREIFFKPTKRYSSISVPQSCLELLMKLIIKHFENTVLFKYDITNEERGRKYLPENVCSLCQLHE